MITAREIFAKVFATFSAPVAPAAPKAPVAAADPAAPAAPADTTAPGSTQTYQLTDGTEIMVTLKDPAANAEPSAGDLVTIAGAPAPAGDLTLVDGTVMTVDASGAITQIVQPGQPVTTDLSKNPGAAAPTMEQRVASLEAELTKLRNPAAMSAVQKVQDAYESALAKLNKHDEVIKGLFELVEKIIEAPSADPKTLNGNKKEQFDRTSSKEKQLESFAAAIKKNKEASKN